MIELGHFALILAFTLAIVQCAAPLAGLYLQRSALRRISEPAALAVFGLILLAFVSLMQAYVRSDFSVVNVFANSHSAKPLIYKISGVWANHEGSMLLWVLILAGFGAAVATFGARLPEDLRAGVLSIQGSISATFVLFILATSNPFLRREPAPIEGLGLNPVLQDPALAIHPPLLYTGYVGFSIAFSFAIAALMLGRMDTAWARWVRPWTLAAWIFLTLGIAVGSWWAYYELGWGGFWFWDPVENASIMPWLAGTALLHSAIVMEKRDSLKAWTILLAILTFSLSLLGTFLVRSGVLTSVHAFASDPTRGIFILTILALFTIGSFALFAWRANHLSAGSTFALASREASLVFNNLVLVVCCGTVLAGTLYPLILERITHDKITIGPPFFNNTVVWLFLLLLVALPFGIFLPWKRGNLYNAAKRLIVAFVAAVIAGISAGLIGGASFKAILALSLCVWVLVAVCSEILWRAQFLNAPFAETARRLFNMRRSRWGSTIGHFGLAVGIIGIIVSSTWNSESIKALKPGDATQLGSYRIVFKGVHLQDGPNYTELAGDFELFYRDRFIAPILASKRAYEAPPSSTTEAGISPRPFGDIYVVLGDEKGGAYAVHAYYHPFVRWIWAGAVIMFMGGFISILDRRLRIGAARRNSTASATAAPSTP